MEVYMDLVRMNEEIREKSLFIDNISQEVGKVIIGQNKMIDAIIMAFLCKGHILLEGVPGLAKTLTIETIANIMDLSFKRIQFTPDLQPADLIGTLIYNQKKAEFEVSKGPIFANIILADEINRAPAKVQSALLEAMQERQVTIGNETFKLPEPFLVLATQNPLEQEGTYPLPEAQVDRFLMKVIVDYPSKQEEKEIIKRMSITQDFDLNKIVKKEEIIRATKDVESVYIDEKVVDYIIDLVFSTRKPGDYKLEKFENFINYGGSPRASINLTRLGKAYAFIKHRGYVTPEDIKNISYDVLRHRIIPTYEAEAEGYSSEMIIKEILDTIQVP
ncbi:MAG: ATPase [Candidatus Muiribacterium halophilum]|uniref:ATPase n=1 Tax=Muiribacterium halophilum TaxID=2053465 RepID=A0A2N5ZKB2_MUIH1|nr:MAG: ATPase [Candidatus Muirbacterium halophilum]